MPGTDSPRCLNRAPVAFTFGYQLDLFIDRSRKARYVRLMPLAESTRTGFYGLIWLNGHRPAIKGEIRDRFEFKIKGEANVKCLANNRQLPRFRPSARRSGARKRTQTRRHGAQPCAA